MKTNPPRGFAPDNMRAKPPRRPKGRRRQRGPRLALRNPQQRLRENGAQTVAIPFGNACAAESQYDRFSQAAGNIAAASSYGGRVKLPQKGRMPNCGNRPHQHRLSAAAICRRTFTYRESAICCPSLRVASRFAIAGGAFLVRPCVWPSIATARTTLG